MTASADNPRYDYSPIVERDRITWPGGAATCLLVVVNVEHFHADHPTSDRTWNGPRPDIDTFAQRDYGNRVGFWRLLEVLERRGIRVTGALNADVCRHYPQIVRAGADAAWEWVGHGWTNSRTLEGLDEAAERDVVKSTLDTITIATGQRPRGWLSPRVTETDRTLDLLAEAGLLYVLDWSADEQPFWMRTTAGRILAMPYSRELNDLPTMVRRNYTAREFSEMIVDQAEILRRDPGRVLSISLHPFVSGHPYRIKWIEAALDTVLQAGDVWVATCGEVADAYPKLRVAP